MIIVKLLDYSDEESLAAVEKLSKHVNGKENFSLDCSNIGVGITVTGDLCKKAYRQSYYKDCKFDSVCGKSIGFSGSKFVSTVFKNCDFENGNLHSCDFRNSSFIGTINDQFKMVSAGFHKSTFTDCTFHNLYIFSCGFTDAIFYNTSFINCTIRLCSLENAQFKKCYFANCNLSTLNLEHAEFENIYAVGSVFPFSTIPVAYGLLQQMPLLEKNNVVYTAAYADHKMPISEYMDLMTDFECYYSSKKKYYALANIYISQNRIEESYKAILVGILSAVKIRDFRTLYHFCKLVYLSDIFTIYQRRSLFENISKWANQESFSLSEYHNYQLFIGSIREMLLKNDAHKPTLYFYLETNIEPDEPQKQTMLLTTIDQIMAYCKVSSSSIELRHNSAYVDLLTIICENFSQFSEILIMIYGSLAGIKLFATGIKEVVDAAQKAISKHDQHVIRKLEQEKMTLEISSLKQEQEYKKRLEDIEYQKAVAEMKKLTLELENMEKECNKHRKILLENDIKILVHHNSKNLKSAPLKEMIQHS